MTRTVVLATLGLLAAACADPALPDPKGAADAFGRAAARGDADAIYAMMTEGARKERSREDVRTIVTDERRELAEEGSALSAKDAASKRRRASASRDGEEAALDLQRGRFYVTSAGALPGGARTPEEALDQLRRVLARRSYAGLMRVLSPSTRAAIEQDLRGLVTGLERPETHPGHRRGRHGDDRRPGRTSRTAEARERCMEGGRL